MPRWVPAGGMVQLAAFACWPPFPGRVTLPVMICPELSGQRICG